MAESEPIAAPASTPALWSGILGPPIIWAARISTSYVLVPYACANGWILPLHFITLAALLLAVAAGLVAWRSWRAAGGGLEVDAGGPDTRVRFMALVGMLSSGLFSAVIVAEGLANFFVHPCQQAGVPIA